MGAKLQLLLSGEATVLYRTSGILVRFKGLSFLPKRNHHASLVLFPLKSSMRKASEKLKGWFAVTPLVADRRSHS